MNIGDGICYLLYHGSQTKSNQLKLDTSKTLKDHTIKSQYTYYECNLDYTIN